MKAKQTSELMKAIIGGVIVIGLPAWAYVLAYFHEYGYLSHFAVPVDLMHIQYINIIAAVLSVVLFIYAVFSYGFNSLHKAAKSPKKVKLIFVLWILFVVVFGLLPLITLKSVGWKVFAVLGVVGVTGRMALDVYKSAGKTFEEKLMAAMEGHERDPFLNWAEGMLGEKIMQTIFFETGAFLGW